MNYYMYAIDKMKDISKVVDYLEVGSPHHVRSYFWWGGIEIEQLHKSALFLMYLLSRCNASKIISGYGRK